MVVYRLCNPLAHSRIPGTYMEPITNTHTEIDVYDNDQFSVSYIILEYT